MLRADRHFLVFPMGKCAGKKRGWVCCLPTRCHGSAPRTTASNGPPMALLQQTELLLPSLTSRCCGRICQDNVPVPLPALPRAYRQGFMSSSGMTGSPMGNWAACARWPTPPSLRAPEGHPQTFTAQ